MATGNDAGAGPSETNNSPPRRPYEPKYSAATEMILQRLRGPGGPLSSNSPLSRGNPLGPVGSAADIAPGYGYEDVKRAVMEEYKTVGSMNTSPADESSITVVTGKKGRPAAPAAGKAKKEGIKVSTPRRQSTAAAVGNSSTKGKGSARKGRPGQKRKRAKEESESPEDTELSDLHDSESDEASFVPTQTLSGRKVVKPAQFTPTVAQEREAPPKKKGPLHYNKKTGRNVEQALCKRCSRGNSPTKNQIVFCDMCNNGWHQNCHDPRITEDVVKDQDAPWFCSTCTAKREKRGKGKAGSGTPTAKTVTPTPVPVVASNPAPAPQNKAPTWGSMTIEQKRVYLSQIPQAHLISALIHATNLHPDLPMIASTPGLPTNTQPSNVLFSSSSNPLHPNNANRKYNHVYPQAPFPPSATSTSGLFTRSEANPSAPMNFIRKIPPGGQTPGQGFASGGSYPISSGSATGISSLQHVSGAPSSTSPTGMGLGSENPVFETSMDVDMSLDNDLDALTGGGHSALNGMGGMHDGGEEEESRESTPASPPYPKPGTGMMAGLKPDDEDLEWLVGDGEADSAFSQTVLEAGVGS